MTGNNKVWRASLAGLASVAMLATMGVSAANAAAQAADFTVTFKDGNTTVKTTNAGYRGESLADLNEGYGVAVTNTEKTVDGVTYYFGGWTIDGTTPVDWNAAVNASPSTNNVDVKALWLTSGYTNDASKSNLAELDFSQAGLTGKVQFPAGTEKFYVAKDQNIPATLLPVDIADRSLITDYVYTTSADPNEQTKAAADLATVTGSNVTVSQLTVTFAAPKTKDAYQVLVDGSDKAQYGFVKGAKADGTVNDKLGVDVEPGAAFTVPDWFTIPQTGEANQTVTSWKLKANNAVVGTKVDAVNADLTLTPASDGVTKGFVTTFLGADGSVWKTTDAAKNDKGSYFVVAPEGNPTKDGF
ncbi:KxYKxGKxW signal peptide, partial [Bifidobacterium sp. DSM 109958]